MKITSKDISRKFINRESKICEVLAFEPYAYPNCPVKYTDGISIGRLPTNGQVSTIGTPHEWDFIKWADGLDLVERLED